MQVINDRASDEDRQKLKRLIPLLIGSRSTPKIEQQRGYLFADRAVRVFAPLSLDAAGQSVEAERLRALPAIVDNASAIVARDAAHTVAYAYASASAAYAAYSAASAYASAAAGAYASAAASAPIEVVIQAAEDALMIGRNEPVDPAIWDEIDAILAAGQARLPAGARR